MKISMETWSFQVPVHHQDVRSSTCQNPRDIRKSKRATRSSFVGVKGDDLTASHPAHVSIPPEGPSRTGCPTWENLLSSALRTSISAWSSLSISLMHLGLTN